jgi:nicotinamidase-related amidase
MDDFSDEALYPKGLGSRVAGGAAAVIVVDVTNGFDPDSPVGADLTEVIAETNRVLAVARSSGVPVIFTPLRTKTPSRRRPLGEKDSGAARAAQRNAGRRCRCSTEPQTE